MDDDSLMTVVLVGALGVGGYFLWRSMSAPAPVAPKSDIEKALNVADKVGLWAKENILDPIGGWAFGDPTAAQQQDINVAAACSGLTGNYSACEAAKAARDRFLLDQNKPMVRDHSQTVRNHS